MMNSTSITGIVPPIRSVQAEREHGFLAATFCPIPVGDSPSSKRMYDVLNFGCIPVVLSDDLVWAYSRQTGGPLNHSEFSIQMPQSLVHFTAQRSLRRFFSKRERLGVLPSGTLLYDLLEQAVTGTNSGTGTSTGTSTLPVLANSAATAGAVGAPTTGFVNPVVEILRRIPANDIRLLQEGVARAAPHFRYYEMNNSMRTIPTSTHVFPGGGAMEMLSRQLEARKAYGIEKLKGKCQTERFRSGHKYVSRYECDTSKQDALVRRRRNRLLTQLH